MRRVVVFDWGGVAQRTIDEGPREQLDVALGLPSGSVERAVFDSEIWVDASTGRCGAVDTWETITTSLGIPREGMIDFVEAFFAGDRVDCAIVRIIQELREKDVPVGLLSNAPPPLPAILTTAARWGMEGLFDVQVFSYGIGIRKPDPRAFRAILAEMRAAPGEALFIDDMQANVDGARAVGMEAILFTSAVALEKELALAGLSLG